MAATLRLGRQPLPWGYQPDIGSAQPSQEWMAAGMRALFDQRSLRELVVGLQGVNDAAFAAGPFGHARDYSSSASTTYPHHPSFAILGPLSIVALIEVDALSNYGGLVHKQATTTTNAPFEWRLGENPTEGNGFLMRAGGAGFGYARGPSGVVGGGYRGALVVTCTAGVQTTSTTTLYWDGGSHVLSTLGGTPPTPTDTGSPIWVGRRFDDATKLDGRIYYVSLFDRALTSGEAQRVIARPWTLFEPMRIWVPVSAGGGDVTAPVLTSPTGVATGSTTATIGATTDEANGTIYGFVSTSATPPSDADLKAGTGAVWAGSATVSGTGANTLNATGLTASTGYYGHLLHADAAANDSNTVTSAQFTTDAGGGGSAIGAAAHLYSQFRRH